ncbi:hypothetical protein AG1IA_04221 [Rhizoctonia solani AG-1 IA]|uniref:Uncharacterized protein n=1 Tax=Thanatephorus cucumeris (strain AG1-IA) TaxID=983506 RepID=L8WZG5_THACA|nr:hypothetical protein AG1IA_04221 [Rhizoctonia solani AG-1 IA]
MSDSRGPVVCLLSDGVYPRIEHPWNFSTSALLHRTGLAVTMLEVPMCDNPPSTAIASLKEFHQSSWRRSSGNQPPSRSHSRSELGYEPQYTEDGKLTISTMVRRLFGLGPKPVSTVKVYDGSNSLFPKLGRKSSRSSSRYVYPSAQGSRQPVQAVYRTH